MHTWLSICPNCVDCASFPCCTGCLCDQHCRHCLNGSKLLNLVTDQGQLKSANTYIINIY